MKESKSREKRVFYQDKELYSFNSDTIFLYAFANGEIKNQAKGKTILDIGSGIGVLGILLALDFDMQLDMCEVQEEFTKLAKTNSEANSIDSEIHNIDLSDFEPEKLYDFIVSNPPFYLSSSIKSENDSIKKARYAEHMPFELIAKKIKRLLKDKGRFIFCYDSKAMDSVIKILKEENLTLEKIRFIHSKIDKSSKVFMAVVRKNSKTNTEVLPPFITFDSENNYTDEASVAFELANTDIRYINTP